MGGLLRLVQREGPGQAPAPPSPILAVPNVTVSVPSSYYIRCGTILPLHSKGLTHSSSSNDCYTKTVEAGITVYYY